MTRSSATRRPTRCGSRSRTSCARHGHQDVDRELARLMNELFAQTRDDVRGRIKAFLEKVPPGKDGSPGLARTQDLPILLEGSEPQTPPATSSPPPESQSPPRWSWLLLAVAAAVVGVVGLGRLGRRDRRRSRGEPRRPPALRCRSGAPSGRRTAARPAPGHASGEREPAADGAVRGHAPTSAAGSVAADGTAPCRARPRGRHGRLRAAPHQGPRARRRRVAVTRRMYHVGVHQQSASTGRRGGLRHGPDFAGPPALGGARAGGGHGGRRIRRPRASIPPTRLHRPRSSPTEPTICTRPATTPRPSRCT